MTSKEFGQKSIKEKKNKKRANPTNFRLKLYPPTQSEALHFGHPAN